MFWLYFKPKLVGKGREREKKENIVPFHPTRRVIENSKKNSQKIQNIKKNTIMASFRAKIGWKMPRKIENKNYRFLPFLHNA